MPNRNTDSTSIGDTVPGQMSLVQQRRAYKLGLTDIPPTDTSAFLYTANDFSNLRAQLQNFLDAHGGTAYPADDELGLLSLQASYTHFSALYDEKLSTLSNFGSRTAIYMPRGFTKAQIKELQSLREDVEAVHVESIRDMVAITATDELTQERTLEMLQGAHMQNLSKFDLERFNNEILPHFNIQVDLQEISPEEERNFSKDSIIKFEGHAFVDLDHHGTTLLSDPKRRVGFARGIVAFMDFDPKAFEGDKINRLAHFTLKQTLSTPPAEVKRLFSPISGIFKVSVCVGSNLVCAICHQTLIGFAVSGSAGANGTQLEHRITYFDLVTAREGKPPMTGGNTYDNLFPAHTHCNAARGKTNFVTWALDTSSGDMAGGKADAVKLINGLGREDLAQYAHYTMYKSMSEYEALKTAEIYIKENEKIDNFVGKGEGHWTEMSAAASQGLVYKSSTINEQTHVEVLKAFGSINTANKDSDIGKIVAALDIDLGKFQGFVTSLKQDLKKIGSTKVTFINKDGKKEVHDIPVTTIVE